MKKLKVPVKSSVAIDDDEAPKKAKVSKKHRRESDDDDDDDEAETDEDEEVLSESRPKTAKDRVRATPKISQKLLKAKRRVVVEDDDEDEEEESDEDRIAYHEAELRKLKQYGSVKLTPKNKDKFGKHTKDGLRRASVAREENEDDDMVKLTMLKTCDPAPRYGNVHAVVDHGHDKLLKGEQYLLPRPMALHLAETKYAILHDESE